MIIGVPKEIKCEEYRVALTPAGACELRKNGHTVLVETGAGIGSGFSDEDYLSADADVLDKAPLFEKAELIVKVKEPLPEEYSFFGAGQALFTYLHLAPNRRLIDFLLHKKITGLAYETLEKECTLPLLAPMSEIAGRMAPLMAAFYMQKIHGGAGVLPTGVEGVDPAKVLILGAGVVGTNAARVCAGLGMHTTVISKGPGLYRLAGVFSDRVKTLPLTDENLRCGTRESDIVIGAVLVTGGRTPVLITKEILGTMKKGSVIVDVSVDQGGCVETSRPTTHKDPIYEVEGVIHYMVANMPGAYPRTSTLALTNATLPYIKLIADSGIEKSIKGSTEIRSALNTFQGRITNKSLAESTGFLFSETFPEI
ncbi:MAG: alanine dehydrogenase [Nitrospirae bacterium]|nr:MAG: alanine dehydrogenase [Nitrospirota bacterium]